MRRGRKIALKVVIALIIFVLLLPFIFLATVDFEERVIAWPLLNAAGRRTWVWPTSHFPYHSVDDEIDGMVSVYIYTNTLREPLGNFERDKEKDSLLFLMQIQDMNEYLASNPKCRLNREKLAVCLRIKTGGCTFYTSNFDFFDYERRYDGIRSAKTDELSMYHYGSDCMREMRSIYYDDMGSFLLSVDDLSVLENLERIGPASNFTEEELAWFAENLPDCEVVDVPAE